MGHVRLARRSVEVQEVAARRGAAPRRRCRHDRGFGGGRRGSEPAFLHAFWLLTQIPLAARGPAFAEDLRRLGLQVSDKPSLMDVGAALSGAVDRYTRERKERTDLGEMAQMAAIESLTAIVGPTLPLLFRSTPDDVQRAIG